MSITFAIDELYATGWSTLDTTGCEYAPDGRLFPGVARATQEFASGGATLTIRTLDSFGCARAEWSDEAASARGRAVGATAQEAAVHALAQWRRAMSVAGV